MAFIHSSIAPLPVDVRPDLLAWLGTIGTVGAVVVAVLVAVVEATRARKARQERDTVIETHRVTERRASARFVSAWIERTYVPGEDSRTYIERVIAHIINEGDLPVYRVIPSVLLSPAVPDGSDPINVGPLSIPNLIPVLPPRRELAFDLSMALIPYRQEERGAVADIPGIEIGFTDANNVGWVRELDGELKERERDLGQLFVSSDDTNAQKQLGVISPINPLAVVLEFLNALSDESLSDSAALKRVKDTLAPEAEGWKSLNASDIPSLREELAQYALGTHVRYPAPTVAWVKLVETKDTELMVIRGEGVVLPIKMFTLIFHADRGWRIFTYGGAGTTPDRIYFPDGLY